MKPEERKEIETNALADRMGTIVRKAKTSNPRVIFLSILVAALLGAVGFYWIRSRDQALVAAERQWLDLDNGSGFYLSDLVRKASVAKTPQGEGARMQLAWREYWLEGMRILMANRKEGISKLGRAEVEFRSILEDAKGDPLLIPEAKYALAVIEETRAIDDPKNVERSLESAKEKYQELVKNHKDSGYGQLAAKRLEALQDETKFDEIRRFYVGMAQQRPQFPHFPEIPFGK